MLEFKKLIFIEKANNLASTSEARWPYVKSGPTINFQIVTPHLEQWCIYLPIIFPFVRADSASCQHISLKWATLIIHQHFIACNYCHRLISNSEAILSRPWWLRILICIFCTCTCSSRWGSMAGPLISGYIITELINLSNFFNIQNARAHEKMLNMGAFEETTIADWISIERKDFELESE